MHFQLFSELRGFSMACRSSMCLMFCAVDSGGEEADSLGGIRSCERHNEAQERSNGLGRDGEGMATTVGLQESQWQHQGLVYWSTRPDRCDETDHVPNMLQILLPFWEILGYPGPNNVCFISQQCLLTKQVLPKVIWKECVATLYGTERTHLLHVLLAVQYPLQMNTITQPQVRYIHTSMPHASYTLGLHYVVSSPPKKKKEICPFCNWRY